MYFFRRYLHFSNSSSLRQDDKPSASPLRKAGSRFFSESTERYIFVVVVVTITLFASYFFSFPQSVQAHDLSSSKSALTYNCRSSLGDIRCYGVVDWNGAVAGAHTTMDVVQLHAGDGHMNNTLWVANSDKTVAAEAGYVVKAGRNYESWYWAYVDGSNNYFEYDSSGLKSGSGGDFGYPAEVTVWRVSGGQWNAAIYGHASSWLPNGFTDTALSPTYIQLGEELEGTNGASSDQHAHFKNNYWITGNNQANYQTNNGYKNEFGAPSNPPSSGWTVSPTSSSTGGDWNSGTP